MFSPDELAATVNRQNARPGGSSLGQHSDRTATASGQGLSAAMPMDTAVAVVNELGGAGAAQQLPILHPGDARLAALNPVQRFIVATLNCETHGGRGAPVSSPIVTADDFRLAAVHVAW